MTRSAQVTAARVDAVLPRRGRGALGGQRSLRFPSRWCWRAGLTVLLGGCIPDPTEGMVRLENSGETFWIDAFEFPNRRGARPALAVTLQEASEACRAVDKRLCTAAEWRRACLGPDGDRRFGYGSEFEPQRCHWGRQLPSGHTSLIGARERVAPSGHFASCRTPEGVFDLPGNVEEWVLDDWHGLPGMLEGGAWYSIYGYSDCTGLYPRQPDYRLDPERRIFSAGFRCCHSRHPPSEDDIAADSQRILREARDRSSSLPYDPSREVRISDELWIDRYEYPNRPGVYPRVAVTEQEAEARCEAAGKHLCSTQEWELACSGAVPGVSGSSTDGGSREGGSAAQCALGLTEPVPSGTRGACVTAAGAHDLRGSVWEWTSTVLDAPILAGSSEWTLREIRGGSWYTHPFKGTCRPATDYPAARQDTAWPDVGFRCCRGALPPTVSEPEFGEHTCPSGMVPIEDFCIDVFEYPNRRGEVPAGGMDLATAKGACASAGKRLCTAEEWRRACGGTAARRWPYGDVFEPGRCQDQSGQPDPEPGVPGAAGQAERCVTPEGVFDLSGNLWEWAEGEADGSPELLGGGPNLAAGLGQCRSRATADPGYADPSFGTRCCLDAGSGATGAEDPVERAARGAGSREP